MRYCEVRCDRVRCVTAGQGTEWQVRLGKIRQCGVSSCGVCCGWAGEVRFDVVSCGIAWVVWFGRSGAEG